MGATYVVPPPAAPPPKSRRKLFLGIGGGVLALLLIASGIFIITQRGGGGSATATPASVSGAGTSTPGASTSAAATISAAGTATANASGPGAQPTPAATSILLQPSGSATASSTRTATVATSATPRATAASATATRAAGSAASGAATATARTGSATARTGTTSAGSATSGTVGPGNVTLGQTFTDPNGHFKFQYPAGWVATRLANSQSNVVEVDGPDNISFYVNVYQQDGTPDDEMQATIMLDQQSTSVVFTPGQIQDATVGGEQGKVMTYTFKRNQGSTTANDGVIWIVNHDGREYDFEAVFVGKHRPEIDAIIKSVVFL
jgi:hypothetical protein